MDFIFTINEINIDIIHMDVNHRGVISAFIGTYF